MSSKSVLKIKRVNLVLPTENGREMRGDIYKEKLSSSQLRVEFLPNGISSHVVFDSTLGSVSAKRGMLLNLGQLYTFQACITDFK